MQPQREHQKPYKSKDYTDIPVRDKEIFKTYNLSKFMNSDTRLVAKCTKQKKSIINIVKLSLI